ncbi:potassium-transporting ATPase subunit C [Xylanimonas oleitrophica]|uniref:Potassium-transporting ATPase KdpC subunit n=1 Tax=Xylanimonas oleitrophica TaxID=2607479 RepID=A0A2W5Y3K0_9MICO|nr:potassium-transporting ATPase subunit KdpC [Xylanimonas oleitrophica]PZR52394.1 potassium-transporting ATPase subunit C [Xylanimonas oleitrophica]
MTTTSVPAPTVASGLAALWRHSLAGLRVLLAFTVLLGLAYPLAVTGIAQAVFPWQANGSLLDAAGERTTTPADAAGSARLAQAFTGPEWFHPRPSAAGDGYDSLTSGGSNLGPNNPDLVGAITERRAAVAAAEGVDPAAVPADAVTASASGLDPDISPAYAALQVERVAAARGLTSHDVRELVAEHTVGRTLGVLGEPHVNVLRLNLALQGLG